MLYHLLVFFFFKQTLDAEHVCIFYVKWYVLLLYLTYHPFFEAGYSVPPNIEA